MDYHDTIDPEDLFFDGFDIDDGHPGAASVNDDYSSWPSVSSPPRVEEDEETGGSDDDIQETDRSGTYQDLYYSEGGEHSEDQEEVEQESEEEGYTEEDQLTDEHEEEDEEEDEDEEDEEDGIEYVLEGELDHGYPGLLGDATYFDPNYWFDVDSDAEPAEPQPRPARISVPDFLSEGSALQEQGRASSESDSEGLFVDQNPISLPAINLLLHSARRTHERALHLVSELESQTFRGQSSATDRRNLPPLAEISATHRHDHRHHPYNMPRDRAQDRARRNSSRDRDELVEVELGNRAATRRNRTPPRAVPEVIDLTGEPDSPEETRAPTLPRPRVQNTSQIPGRNPRRQMSLNQRTPSLSRSDGSLLGNDSEVIDLTLDDSPAPPPLPQQLPRRHHHHHHHHHNHQHHHRRLTAPRTQPINLEDDVGSRIFGLVRQFARPLDIIHRLGFRAAHPEVEVQIIGGRGLNNMDNPLAGNIPDLDYRSNGRNGGAANKPEHVPPPAAREGFTRATGSEDDVVVCPSCEQELKYDPDAEDDTVRPVKKPRTKKDQADNHFWALKECGHVYCKECYEKRRFSAKNSNARFRRGEDNPRKILCSVEGCSTEVNAKANWVGLFL
ncbi:hypothetical protein VTI74DRAFT_10936 [Chaetomium olivicolor]